MFDVDQWLKDLVLLAKRGQLKRLVQVADAIDNKGKTNPMRVKEFFWYIQPKDKQPGEQNDRSN